MRKSYICIAGGILGLIATVVAGIYAAKKEEQEKEETPDDPDESIFHKAVKKVVRYKFVIILGVLTGITFACSVNHYAYQTGCAITAYRLLRKEYDDYVGSATSILGVKKEDDVRSASIRREMNNIPPKVRSVGNGSTLIYEPVSKTYYEGTLTSVQDAQDKINAIFDDPNGWKIFISFRELLNMLGLREAHLDDRKTELNIGIHKYDGPFTIKYNVQVMDTGERCVVLMYNLAPRYDYDW